MRLLALKSLLFATLVLCQPPIQLQSIELYSRLNTIEPETVHSYLLDYSCGSYPGNLQINVNQPNFNNVVGSAFTYISQGPASGPYAPFPDPDNNKTFRWSTEHNYDPPTPGVTIPNANGNQYYVTVNCAAEDCQYELASQLTPIKGAVINTNKQECPQILKTRVPAKQQALFYSNRFVLNSTVNWNDWAQFAIPMCQSALYAIFGSKTICLSSYVIGQGPGYMFYQQFKTDALKQIRPLWQTRAPTADPYKDLSGKSDLTINRFLSLPTSIKDLPPVLYHSVVGEGGQGVQFPYPNLFSATYEFVECID